MTISRWEPFRELATMQHGLNRIFNSAFPHVWERPFRGEDAGERVWAPAVDVFETDRDLVFKVELAGVDPNDVEVRVEDNTLYLKGHRKLEKDTKDQKYHHRERFLGSFARSFTLPHSVDSEKVAAEYRDGVLTLTLPKKEAAKPKTIKISVSGS
jgi:HSP20 family protein